MHNESVSQFRMTAPDSQWKDSVHLKRGHHINNISVQSRLHKLNYQYGIVWNEIISNTSRRKDASFLEAITVELKPDWYKGMIGRNQATQYLKDFISFGILIRHSPRSNKYYVNPKASHCLTTDQRNEYGDKYKDMFPTINIQTPDQDSD